MTKKLPPTIEIRWRGRKMAAYPPQFPFLTVLRMIEVLNEAMPDAGSGQYDGFMLAARKLGETLQEDFGSEMSSERFVATIMGNT